MFAWLLFRFYGITEAYLHINYRTHFVVAHKPVAQTTREFSDMPALIGDTWEPKASC